MKENKQPRRYDYQKSRTRHFNYLIVLSLVMKLYYTELKQCTVHLLYNDLNFFFNLKFTLFFITARASVAKSREHTSK